MALVKNQKHVKVLKKHVNGLPKIINVVLEKKNLEENLEKDAVLKQKNNVENHQENVTIMKILKNVELIPKKRNYHYVPGMLKKINV